MVNPPPYIFKIDPTPFCIGGLPAATAGLVPAQVLDPATAELIVGMIAGIMP